MHLNTEKYDLLRRLLSERILLLDGGMGTMVEQAGCGDVLADTLVEQHPDIILDIHRKYLEAGSDIIETDSFNSNALSLADYGLSSRAYEFSKKAAELARRAADEYTAKDPGRPRFVAGSVGPTKHMLSLGEDPSLGFDIFADAYYDQIRGLLDGGADIILLETIFDTLNAKAAVYAVERLAEERGEKIPVMVSATVATPSGHLLCGQSIEAFYASIRHASLLAVGLNCGFGSGQFLPFLSRLAAIADVPVSVYPNAGLPDDCGHYCESPEIFTKNVEEYLNHGLVNIVGGCCGTTPLHIRALRNIIDGRKPRPVPSPAHHLYLSGSEFMDTAAVQGLIHVGERTNMAGSARFARLIREKKFAEGLEIARKQVVAGAQIIDVCMDDGMEDAGTNMTTFLKMLTADSDTGKVPVMIDSSDWNVITAALKVCPGKSVVNSISLKEGEEQFLTHAREIHRLGAAAVVMLFDEKGQADAYERKIEVAGRAYNLLTSNGFPPEDIIFDPNVLTVGTGLAENDTLALAFIKATVWISRNLPYAGVSGGISNLSFAFRGNNPLREAMHTAFLYHAVKAGLTMAIVNSQKLRMYDDIDPRMLLLIEDLLLCRRDDAASRLSEFALKMNEQKEGKAEGPVGEEDFQQSLASRIELALLKGRDTDLAILMEEAMQETSPLEVIDSYLMPVMGKIGTMFGEGRMFLPQVIRSAQVMKKAVSILQPFIEGDSRSLRKASVVLATVRGDVHDIGKNIVGLVASCNGFEVEDLGVRVEPEVIAEAAGKEGVAAVLLSGLISPSLNEMVKVCEELERRGLHLPVIIGGAATSPVHTAVKIAPACSGPVIYSPDANANMQILKALQGPERDRFIEENRTAQEILRKEYAASRAGKADRPTEKVEMQTLWKVPAPSSPGIHIFHQIPVEEVAGFIDWKWLLSSLDMFKPASGPGQSREKEGAKVVEDAKKILDSIISEKYLRIEGAVGIFAARRNGDDILLQNADSAVLPMLRGENGKCTADFLDVADDHVALFAVTAGNGMRDLMTRYIEKGDEYSAFLAKLVGDRLAEAAAQWLHREVAQNLWGYAKGSDRPEKEGARIAFGYPAAPDHSLKRDVFDLLNVENNTSMRLTETYMIVPEESVSGMILPRGEYINVGKVSEEAIAKYADARKMSINQVKNLIPNNCR